MIDVKRQKTDATFGYAAVETALAEAFKTNQRTLLSLRARLKSLQRAGLTPDNPGRGKVIRYRRGDVYDLSLAASLADFHLDAQAICAIVKMGYFASHWVPEIEAKPDEPDKADTHLFFGILPTLFFGSPTVPAPYILLWGSEISAAKIASYGGRVGLIDLTDLKRRVDDALEAAKSRSMSRPVSRGAAVRK